MKRYQSARVGVKTRALDIVRGVMGTPLREEASPDGTIQLIVGDPGEVVVTVSDERVSIFEYGIEWQGPHTPVERHTPLGDIRLDGISGKDLEQLVSEWITVTRRRRRRRFRTCKFCDEKNPPEWMHARDVCQGCAERVLGVVH